MLCDMLGSKFAIQVVLFIISISQMLPLQGKSYFDVYFIYWLKAENIVKIELNNDDIESSLMRSEDDSYSTHSKEQNIVRDKSYTKHFQTVSPDLYPTHPITKNPAQKTSSKNKRQSQKV